MKYPAQKTSLIHTLGFKSVYPSVLVYAKVDQLPDFTRLVQAVERLKVIVPQLACRYDFEENSFYPVEEPIVYSLSADEDPYERPLDFLRLPQLKIYLRQQADYGELFFIGSHIMSDAAGFKQLIYSLVALYNDPQLQLGENQLDIMDVYRQFTQQKLAIQRQDLANHSLSLTFSRSKQPMLRQAHWVELAEADFNHLKAVAHEREVSLNDVFLTAYMRFLARENPTTEKIQLACPTDTRQFLSDRSGLRIGNYTARYNPTVAINPVDDFWVSAKAVHQEMLLLKENHEFYESVQTLFTDSDQTIESLRQGLSNSYHPRKISYTNMMTLEKTKLNFEDCDVQTAVMSGAFRKVPNYQVCFNSFAGHLNLVCTVEGDLTNQQEAIVYLEAVKAELLASLRGIFE